MKSSCIKKYISDFLDDEDLEDKIFFSKRNTTCRILDHLHSFEFDANIKVRSGQRLLDWLGFVLKQGLNVPN
jgi:hypothetical protein